MNVIETAKFLPNPDAQREQCVEKCMGCRKMYSDEYIGDVCVSYANPSAIQRLGCPIQFQDKVEDTKKKKINPIKASKRARRKGIR